MERTPGPVHFHCLGEVLSLWSIPIRHQTIDKPCFVAIIKTFPEQEDAFGIHEHFLRREGGREVIAIGSV